MMNSTNKLSREEQEFLDVEECSPCVGCDHHIKDCISCEVYPEGRPISKLFQLDGCKYYQQS